MRTIRSLALGASLLALLVGACTTGGGSATPAPSVAPTVAPTAAPTPAPTEAPTASPAGPPPAVRIGSYGFDESKILAELYAQVLENGGFPVERKFGLGTRDVTAPAIEGGQIDVLPEYIGSGLGHYDKSKPSGDANANWTALAQILAGKGGGISVLRYTPAQDTNAFVVRQDTADQLKLASMSDLAKVAGQLTWGLPPECATNPLCGGALKDAYGVDVATIKVKALAACDAPIAQALQNKAVDVAELCSTQPAIAQFGFVVLADDKQTQPAENIAPLVRADYLAKVDAAAFTTLLDTLSAAVTTEELTKLGVEVSVNHKDVGEAVKAWLTAQGLLK